MDRTTTRSRILDEHGACVGELDTLGDADAPDEDQGADPVVALSADGTRVLHVTAERLRVLATDGGAEVAPSIDLRPLHPALQLPEDDDLWQRVAAVFAVPAALTAVSRDAAGDAIADAWGDRLSDDELDAAVDVARTWPAMPTTLPR